MTYLSNYYKNLAEQLEERINHLTQLIENETLTPDNHDGPDADSKGSSAEVDLWAQSAALETDPNFHDDIIHALSHHIGTNFPHIRPNEVMTGGDHRTSSVDDLKTTLKIAGEPRYKSFAQALDVVDEQINSPHGYHEKTFEAMNDGIGFDKANLKIVDHNARQANYAKVMLDMHKKSIDTVADLQDKRGVRRLPRAYYANRTSSNT